VPLDLAKQVVGLVIDSLDDQDRLELIEFSNEPRRYKGEPIAGTARAKRDAIDWVHQRTASGGTEMMAAVVEALRSLRPGSQRQVVVVTDGYVGGEQQILRALHDKLPASCRLHVLGVGSAVNRSLAIALARAGRGAEVLVGLDEDIERGTKRLVDRTRMPVLTDVEVSGSALVRCAPEHVPDVFEGAPVVAAVALRPEGGELVVRGTLARDSWVQRIHVPPAAQVNPAIDQHSAPLRGAARAGEAAAIVSLYARELVADLETRWTIGDRDAIDREIEATGVKFQIATRLTSWVAIDETRRTDGPSHHEVMPQALPYGTHAASFGLRAGAPMPATFAAAGSAGYAMAQAQVSPSMFKTMMVQQEKTIGDTGGFVMPGAAHARMSAPKTRKTWWLSLTLLGLLVAIALLLWWLLA
jgi:Ca-activated chloride channel family protein